MRLVQLLGEEVEEIWEFAGGITDAEIQKLWNEYKRSENESFEEYIDQTYSELLCRRVFVDEIYVD